MSAGLDLASIRSPGAVEVISTVPAALSRPECLGSAGNGEAAFPVSVDSAPSGRGFSRHWGSIVR
jgi:hypothetical protein